MDETDRDFVPAETSKRRQAREAEPPRYYLTTPQYINDRYYTDDIEIVYRGVPNEGMEPRNAAAETKVNEWLESLPAPLMRHEDFLAQAIANRPRHDLPATQPTATKRKASRVIGQETSEETDVEVIMPDQSRVKNPKKQMGTIVAEVPSPGSI